MKNLRMLLLGGTLLLGAAPLAAQNSVDVLGGGPQPANTIGCVSPPGNPNCIPATWSTTSNRGADITVAIAKNFVFDSNGGGSPTGFSSGTGGQNWLADTPDLCGSPPFTLIPPNHQ